MRIILARHGESEGNIDRSIYNKKPDYALRLTEKGYSQALSLGVSLARIPGKWAVYNSPFFRARDTRKGILESGLDVAYSYEDSRLREQEWSGRLSPYDMEAERERSEYGHYFYRFDGGESCADVEDRISSFLNTFWRDVKKRNFPKNILIITHGMTMRVFIKRWFKMSFEEFEKIKNPKNCEIYEIEQHKRFFKKFWVLRNDFTKKHKESKYIYNNLF